MEKNKQVFCDNRMPLEPLLYVSAQKKAYDFENYEGINVITRFEDYGPPPCSPSSLLSAEMKNWHGRILGGTL